MTSMFPNEVTKHVPFILLSGAEEVRVEQHDGLVSYKTDQIVLRTHSGALRITGKELLFSQYSTALAVIHGTIEGIAFTGSDGGDRH